jgi:hypothetical protein
MKRVPMLNAFDWGRYADIADVAGCSFGLE